MSIITEYALIIKPNKLKTCNEKKNDILWENLLFYGFPYSIVEQFIYLNLLYFILESN